MASKNNLDIARRLFENQPPASARVRDKRGQVRAPRCLSFCLDGAFASRAYLHHSSNRIYRHALTKTQYALHRAAAIGSVPMINLLIKNKSPLSATDSDGQTALHHAVAEGHGDAAVALLKAGAETDKRDLDGHLALDLAPDKEVRKYIQRMAENEGIEL